MMASMALPAGWHPPVPLLVVRQAIALLVVLAYPYCSAASPVTRREAIGSPQEWRSSLISSVTP